jgi:hypothetical protein
MSSQIDPPIIITGGSVTIKFDSDAFGEVGPGEYKNQDKVITRVQINGTDIENHDLTVTGTDLIISITYS